MDEGYLESNPGELIIIRAMRNKFIKYRIYIIEILSIVVTFRIEALI
jgi:hypothetical protein